METPDYSKYTYKQLLEARGTIDVEKYPDRTRELDRLISEHETTDTFKERQQRLLEEQEEEAYKHAERLDTYFHRIDRFRKPVAVIMGALALISIIAVLSSSYGLMRFSPFSLVLTSSLFIGMSEQAVMSIAILVFTILNLLVIFGAVGLYQRNPPLVLVLWIVILVVSIGIRVGTFSWIVTPSFPSFRFSIDVGPLWMRFDVIGLMAAFHLTYFHEKISQMAKEDAGETPETAPDAPPSGSGIVT